MNRWLLLITMASLLVLVSCQDDTESVSDTHDAHDGHDHSQEGPAQAGQGAHGQPQIAQHTGVIEEVLQAASYTYLNIKEGSETIWIAIPKQELEVGQTVSFAAGLEMKNFPSKDLDRTFETVYLVSSVSTPGSPQDAPAGSAPTPHGKPEVEVVAISVEPAAGGISLETLFANPQAYAGKSVTIRGQVTKFNRAIMSKNWVHLQDGTKSASGPHDLTLTTMDQVTVGETVTFTGKIGLNKDFGYGYAYDVIMEESKRIE